jgi:hypothetical protein
VGIAAAASLVDDLDALADAIRLAFDDLGRAALDEHPAHSTSPSAAARPALQRRRG